MRFLTTTALVALIAAPALADGWKEDYQVLKFGILSGENEKDRLRAQRAAARLPRSRAGR